MTGKIIIALFLTIFLISASCASHTAVYPEPVNIQSVIEPGDTVRIVTKDNQETEFVVTEVTDEDIIGENIRVPLNDITGMEEETVSAGKNALNIAILTLGVASAVILSAPELYSTGFSPDIFSTLEEVPGWVKGCIPYYPMYHPGDMYATGIVGIYTGFEYIGIDERLCIEGCDSRFNCKYENIEDSSRRYFKGIKSCSESLWACKFECIEKGHPIGDIAEGIEGGYYSDGSYYSTCKSDKSNPFLNLHPTNDKYEKTKWQKDRDECMKLTFENIKPNFWNPTRSTPFINRSIKYYRECLNERGYSIELY